MTGLTGLALLLALKLAPAPQPVDWTEATAALRSVKADPAPAEVTNGIHYVTSNERRLDLFLPEVAATGGVHIGVGSDQNYILAGWSRPELMIIVDFDQAVVDMHAIYGALFAGADTLERFLALWSTAGAGDARQAITDATPSRARRSALLALYDSARADVAKRLDVLLGKYDDLGIQWYLQDPKQYAAVRELATAQRIVAVRGDFTADGVLREIADILDDQGHTVSVLYLSNIEQYFMYGKPFRANMLGLPFDHRTLVLRTLPGRPAGFQYILQKGENFHAWLSAKSVYSVYGLRKLDKGEHLVASEKYVIDEMP